MDTTAIQKRLDALVEGMLAKALIRPEARAVISANCEPAVSVHWCAKEAKFYADEGEYFHGDIESSLAEAEAYVAALPSPEQARVMAFMSALSEAIELGKKADIDGEFVNPLMALMRRLSKNALQHKPLVEGKA